jgi:muramoyltetrapeptide carboxypeptidase LdcA involved in peptidoglycan recycling
MITVLPYLDAGLPRANPKPFFGYGDGTNLLTADVTASAP